MNTVTIEVPFAVNESNGNVSFIAIDLLKIAESLAKEKIVKCNGCGNYFVRGRGNPRYCDNCREGRNNG